MKNSTLRKTFVTQTDPTKCPKKGELTIDDSAIIGIIRYYTREAGVRGLEREISKLCRKAVKALLMDKSLKHLVINDDNLKDYLGVRKVDYGRADTENRIGQVTGLAWTEVGGDLLTIETACVRAKVNSLIPDH